jgi:predicted ribosomally synthesized peptide with nif11-like leader
MAKEQALQFILRANSDQTLQGRLKAIKDGGAGLVRLGDESGFDFTLEEMQTVMAEQQNPESGELSDEALELVSGGLVVIAIIAVLIGM